MSECDATLFLRAAAEGDLETLKALTKTTEGNILIRKHDEIKKWSYDCDLTALMLASRMGQLEIVKFLVEMNVNFNKRDTRNGYTALHVASWNGCLNVVSFLIEKGVNVNEASNSGSTALHWASRYGYEEMTKYLIDEGAEVNRQNNFGRTPLHLATYHGKLNLVNLLLENGADPYIRDDENNNVIDEAKQRGLDHVVNAIFQRKLIRCQDKLPIDIWPYSFARIKSVGCMFGLVCEVPHLFQLQQQQQANPSFSVPHHPDCPACKSRLGRSNLESAPHSTGSNQWGIG